MEEQEVLGDDRSSGTTEVEGEGIFNRTEIMELENEILREEALRTPDDPTDANWRKTKLVCSIILSIHLQRVISDLRPEVLIDTTLGILKSQTNFGVANGATKPPEAAST